MKIEGNILTADAGMEIYKVSEPEIYGKKITLGKNDSADNWGERKETIIEIEQELPDIESTTKRGKIIPVENEEEKTIKKKRSLFSRSLDFLLFWK